MDIFDLPPSYRTILLLILKGSDTWRDLKDVTGLGDSTLAKKLNTLEEKMLITREIHKADHRIKIYKLTEKGQKLAEEFKDILDVARLAKKRFGRHSFEFSEDRDIEYLTDFWLNSSYNMGETKPDSMLFVLVGSPTRGMIIVHPDGDRTYSAYCYNVSPPSNQRTKSIAHYIFEKIDDGMFRIYDNDVVEVVMVQNSDIYF